MKTYEYRKTSDVEMIQRTNHCMANNSVYKLF